LVDGAVWQPVSFYPVLPGGLCPSFDKSYRPAVAFNNASDALEPFGRFNDSLPTYFGGPTGSPSCIDSEVPDLTSDLKVDTFFLKQLGYTYGHPLCGCNDAALLFVESEAASSYLASKLCCVIY